MTRRRARLRTTQAGSMSRRKGREAPVAGARRAAQSPGCPRASSSMHGVADGGCARPAHRLIRPWAAPEPSLRHLPHSLATPARAAHDIPSPPFVLQDISLVATEALAPCGSHDRRDRATRSDAGLPHTSHGRCRTRQSHRPGLQGRHDPMTLSARRRALPRQATEPAEGVG